MGAFAQEVGLCGKAKRAFPQDHANGRGLLGSGSVAELKGGEVGGVAIAQELKQQKRRIKKVKQNEWKEVERRALRCTGFGTSLKVGQRCKSERS